MKKIFTLFAAALVAFGAFADDVPCPSVLSFQLSEMNADNEIVAAEQVPANNVMIELQLVNASANLNGFNMEIAKQTAAGEYCESIAWLWMRPMRTGLDSAAMAQLSLQWLQELTTLHGMRTTS